MKKNNIVLIVIAIVTLLTFIIGATYAYFATGILNVSNVANLNVVTERNNMVFDTLGGEMTLNVTASNMVEAKQGNVAAENNTTLTVNFTANTDYSMVCTYDIVYEWTSTDKYTAHTSGVTDNEFTVQGTLASNAHVSQGTNNISSETDLSSLTYTNYSAVVVSGAQIDGTGNAMSTAVWTLTSKFYNVSQDQSSLSGKTYAGKFKVANVSCVSGEVSNTSSGPTGYWFAYDDEHTFPSYGGTLQTSGTETGHNIYIGQDSSKYYACATIQGHEVCLSQPFTQYGLDGYIPCDDVDACKFSSEQQASAKQAIYQVFTDAGISIDLSNCTSSSSQVSCRIDNIMCGLYYFGDVLCQDRNEHLFCWATDDGTAIID